MYEVVIAGDSKNEHRTNVGWWFTAQKETYEKFLEKETTGVLARQKKQIKVDIVFHCATFLKSISGVENLRLVPETIDEKWADTWLSSVLLVKKFF